MKILDSYNKLNALGKIERPYPNIKNNKKLMSIVKGSGKILDIVNDNLKKHDPHHDKLNKKINVALQ